MKRFFLGIFLLVLVGGSTTIAEPALYNNDPVKTSNEVKIMSKGNDGINLIITAPKQSSRPTDNPDWLKTAQKHCSSLKKNTYYAFVEKAPGSVTHYGAEKFDIGFQKGSDGDVRTVFRFICAENTNDAYNVGKNDRSLKDGDMERFWKYNYNRISLFELKRELFPQEIAANKARDEKEFLAKLEEEKKIKATKRQNKVISLEASFGKVCAGTTFKKGFTKGTPEYENCLFEKEKLANQEQNKLVNLPAEERYAYTCEKTYGFKKGSDNFKECVFKIMTTEYEMQNQLNQRRIAELERKVTSNQANTTYQNEMLEIERMKAKAMQDQVNFARNKDITDTLLGISQNLLTTPSRPSPNAPQMFNCQTRKLGGFDQIQCF
jgi:hypothetical protein